MTILNIRGRVNTTTTDIRHTIDDNDGKTRAPTGTGQEVLILVIETSGDDITTLTTTTTTAIRDLNIIYPPSIHKDRGSMIGEVMAETEGSTPLQAGDDEIGLAPLAVATRRSIPRKGDSGRTITNHTTPTPIDTNAVHLHPPQTQTPPTH